MGEGREDPMVCKPWAAAIFFGDKAPPAGTTIFRSSPNTFVLGITGSDILLDAEITSDVSSCK